MASGPRCRGLRAQGGACIRLLKQPCFDSSLRTCFTVRTAKVLVIMRGTAEASGSLFSYVDLAARIPARHPLRKIRQIVNDALASLDGECAAL